MPYCDILYYTTLHCIMPYSAAQHSTAVYLYEEVLVHIVQRGDSEEHGRIGGGGRHAEQGPVSLAGLHLQWSPHLKDWDWE
jgi:hypothetical protein